MAPTRDDLEAIRQAAEAWTRDILEPARKQAPERKPAFRTSSQDEIPRLATPLDAAGLDYLRDLGFPGEFPFTRGVQPTMYRGRLWTMRQYAGFATARETNERFRFLLGQGQTGLSVAFDLPTQVGLDSDHPLAAGEVGKTGVAVDTLADLETLFDLIPLDKVSTSMTINATAAVLLAMYVALAEKRDVAPAALSGTVQNDILKEYVARGTYIFPPQPSMRLVTDIFAYCAERLPLWNTISISGYHIREAGATAAQEIGFTLADGIAYVEAAAARGLDVDQFGARLSFFFNAHNNLFEEVAKFRAARRLWARLMKERFGASSPKAQMMRFHCQTAGSALTAQQPDNNIVRVTVQALAAVLGGAQSLHTNSRDEALALPTEPSVRIALRTQQVLAYESGAADTVDPLAGSYYVERLTDELEGEARAVIEAVDRKGGMIKAIEEGYVQRRIQDSAYAAQKRVASEEDVVVGVNRFRVDEPEPESILRVDPSVEAEQVRRLAEVKAGRDAGAVRRGLARVREAAGSADNLLPPILEAVRAYATLGEISDVLRGVFGEYREKVVV
ncbi:MAG: methylmalonyl-CoA mutase [Candidatus Aminicenantes bacterium]|nr:methylmalonyl-CoA mutase [Candidatus Aminicenantes bacterium]